MGRSHRPGQSGSRKGEYLMAKICMAGAGSVIETAEYIKKEMLERGGISPELCKGFADERGESDRY